MTDVLIVARHVPLAGAAARGAARRPGPVPLRGSAAAGAARRRQLAGGRPHPRARPRPGSCSRSRRSASTSCCARGPRRVCALERGRPRARAATLGLEPARHAAQPSRSATPTACARRDRADGRPALLRRAAPRQDRAELAGIRRACRAAEAGIAAASSMLRQARARATACSDARRRAAHRASGSRRRCGSAFGDARLPRQTSSSSRTAPQTAVGHEMGSGPIASGEHRPLRPLPARPTSRPASPT